MTLVAGQTPSMCLLFIKVTVLLSARCFSMTSPPPNLGAQGTPLLQGGHCTIHLLQHFSIPSRMHKWYDQHLIHPLMKSLGETNFTWWSPTWPYSEDLSKVAIRGQDGRVVSVTVGQPYFRVSSYYLLGSEGEQKRLVWKSLPGGMS